MYNNFYFVTVVVDGDKKGIEKLRQYMSNGDDAVRSFLDEYWDGENPLEKGKREFTVGVGDSTITNVREFLNSIAEEHPDLTFLAYSEIDDEYGYGCMFWFYVNGNLDEEEEYFYERHVSGQHLAYIARNSCVNFLRKKLNTWLYDNDEAKEEERIAEEDFSIIDNFFKNTDYFSDDYPESLDLSESISWIQPESIEKILKLLIELEEEQGFREESIKNIKKINFTGQKLDKIPELNEFSGLKTLDLTDTGIKNLPPYLNKKVKAGTLEIIGLTALKQQGDDGDNDDDDGNGDGGTKKQSSAPATAETTRTCTACGKALKPTAKFCPSCGVKQALVCPSCGKQAKEGAKFCGGCGTKLDKS